MSGFYQFHSSASQRFRENSINFHSFCGLNIFEVQQCHGLNANSQMLYLDNTFRNIGVKLMVNSTPAPILPPKNRKDAKSTLLMVLARRSHGADS